MYTLYAMHGSCSLAVHIILNELGQEVNIVNVRDDRENPAFVAVSPFSQVPVLVDEEAGVSIREGAAIMMYLLNKHSNQLMPRDSSAAQAQALEALMFANASMHPAYSRVFFLGRQVVDDAPNKSEIIGKATEIINKLWAHVESKLTNSKYICGDQYTAADILLAVIANWIKTIEFGPNTKRMFKDISSIQSFVRALEREQVTYTAAD